MDAALYASLFVINNKLNRILKILGDEVMPELEALTAAVTKVELSFDALAAKVQQLKDQGQTNVDPAVLQGLADRLNAVGDKALNLAV